MNKTISIIFSLLFLLGTVSAAQFSTVVVTDEEMEANFYELSTSNITNNIYCIGNQCNNNIYGGSTQVPNTSTYNDHRTIINEGDVVGGGITWAGVVWRSRTAILCKIGLKPDKGAKCDNNDEDNSGYVEALANFWDFMYKERRKSTDEMLEFKLDVYERMLEMYMGPDFEYYKKTAIMLEMEEQGIDVVMDGNETYRNTGIGAVTIKQK